MAFWGVVLKPNEPYILHYNGTPRRLRISQATLADRNGLSSTRSLVQCAIGNKPPIFLFSITPKEASSCQLDLEFDETEDVIFSVKGPRGVHLVGYFHDSNPTTTLFEEKKDVLTSTASELKTTQDMTNGVHYETERQIPSAGLEEGGALLREEYFRNENIGGSPQVIVVMSDDANVNHTTDKSNQRSEEENSIGKNLTMSPREKPKHVEVERDALESHTKLEKRLHDGYGREGSDLSAMKDIKENKEDLVDDEYMHVGKKIKAGKLSKERDAIVEAENAKENEHKISDIDAMKDENENKQDLADSEDKHIDKKSRDGKSFHLQSIKGGHVNVEAANAKDISKSLTMSLREKQKHVEVEHDALESRTQLEKSAGDAHVHSKKVEKKKKNNKKKYKDMEEDSARLDSYVINGKDSFQLQDQHFMNKGDKEIAKENVVIGGPCLSHKRSKGSKRRREQQLDGGNPKGVVVGGSSSVTSSQTKKQKKIVGFAEASPPALDLPEDERILKEHVKLRLQDEDGTTEEIGRGCINGDVDRKQIHIQIQSHDDKLSRVPEKKKKKKKKKKKIRMGEGIVGDDMVLNSQQQQCHALVSQSKFPNVLHDGQGREGSDLNAMKDIKEKKEDLAGDEDKHVEQDSADSEDKQHIGKKRRDGKSLYVQSIKGGHVKEYI